jgi:hypothetical protein
MACEPRSVVAIVLISFVFCNYGKFFIRRVARLGAQQSCAYVISTRIIARECTHNTRTFRRCVKQMESEIRNCKKKAWEFDEHLRGGLFRLASGRSSRQRFNPNRHPGRWGSRSVPDSYGQSCRLQLKR